MKGRKIKLTREMVRLIAAGLRAGNYVETVCDVVGIRPASFYSWLSDAEKVRNKAEGYTKIRHQALKLELLDAVKKSQAVAEARALEVITRASHDSWQAAAWFLERKFPARWGRRERVELGNADGKPLEVRNGTLAHVVLQDELAAEYAAGLFARIAGFLDPGAPGVGQGLAHGHGMVRDERALADGPAPSVPEQ